MPALAAESIRLGVVSFINTLPLIDGLERLSGVELRYSVPSLLLEMLLSGEVDVALASSIDYQRSPEPLCVLPVGMLGCDGPTLTVRLYSRDPLQRIREVHCDTDSHTSVALLRILLRERYGLEPSLIDYDARGRAAAVVEEERLRESFSEDRKRLPEPPAVMLIGDKVVTDAPPQERYPHQLDLGAAWAEATGLPFVFALWMARLGADPARLALAAAFLDRQRRHNRERLDLIVHRSAVPRGWPRATARDYLGGRIAFELTGRRREGLELFFEKARAHGLIDRRRALVFWSA